MMVKIIAIILCMCMFGCNVMNDPTGGDSMTGGVESDGLTTLAAINFSSDVMRGTNPTNFSISGGSIDFAGGTATTIGIVPLYFNDSFAWTLTNGGTATITFNDLDVRQVAFYLPHSGSSSVTLSAEGGSGEVLGTVESFQATLRGDGNAMFTIDGQGETIQRLTIVVGADAIASLDNLILTVNTP